MQTVKSARMPAEVMAIIMGRRIDAAILDVNLNGAHSVDSAVERDARGVPFMVSTGCGAMSLDERFRIRPMLQKPFRQEELASTLYVMLRRP